MNPKYIMKATCVLFLFVLTSFVSVGQQGSVTSLPVFAEGKMTLAKFLEIYLEYPEEAMKNNEEGEVTLRVRIDAKGESLGNYIGTSVSPSLDKEALRVGELFPRWTPAMIDTMAVPCEFQMKINFNLDDFVSPVDVRPQTLNPLYVLNGKILKEDMNIDENNIVSVQVIKGSEAIKKYGKAAKDGVILITTSR